MGKRFVIGFGCIRGILARKGRWRDSPIASAGVLNPFRSDYSLDHSKAPVVPVKTSEKMRNHDGSDPVSVTGATVWWECEGGLDGQPEFRR